MKTTMIKATTIVCLLTAGAIHAEAAGVQIGDKLKLGADLRLRYDYMNNGSATPRQRQRIRARVGLLADLTDQFTGEFRLATGGASNSANVDLGGGAAGKAIFIDRANMQWKPMGELSIIAGKAAVPFVDVQKGELLWDGDLNLEGTSLSYRRAFDEHEVGLVGGLFWNRESAAAADSLLAGVELDAKVKAGPVELRPIVGYFSYSSIAGRTANSGTIKGNTTAAGAAYASDFRVLELAMEVGTKIDTLPVGLGFDYITNTAASTLKNGWLLGGYVGKAKDADDKWSLTYNYRMVEADATLAEYSNSDFRDGGTDGKGHIFGARYLFGSDISAGASYFLNSVGKDADLDFHRVFLDVVFAI